MIGVGGGREFKSSSFALLEIGFKDTVANLALPSLHGESLKITLKIPLNHF